MAYNTTQIKGDLALTHDMEVGHGLSVCGNSTFNHVKVKGWLECENLKGVNKGLFPDYESLLAAYPNPEEGWFAVVGDTLPGSIYYVSNGEWQATGKEGGEFRGDIDVYNRQLEEVVSNISENATEIVGIKIELETIQKLLEEGFGSDLFQMVDRGMWSDKEDYYCKALNPITQKYETSNVWYRGCKYRCTKTLTKEAPRWNQPDWIMIEGNPEFIVTFAEGDSVFDPDNFKCTLSIVATLYNMDITDDVLAVDVFWTRYSEDASGVERTLSDQAWALKRGKSGKRIELTEADCDFEGYMPNVLRFIATVVLRDGMSNEVASGVAVVDF